MVLDIVQHDEKLICTYVPIGHIGDTVYVSAVSEGI